MTTETGQVVPSTNTPPPPDPDAAKYEELRKELGIEAEANEPEPALEPKAEPDPEPQHVPRTEHENVQKALREARAAEQTAKAEKAAILQLIEQTRAQRQQPQPEKVEPAKIPSEQEDPIGHFKAVNAQLTARLDAIEKGSQQTAEQLQSSTQHQQLLRDVQRSETAILDPKNPEAKTDYWDACAYLEGQRERELQRMYPDTAPFAHQYAQQQGFRSVADLRQAVLNHDRWAVAVQALQMGVSPAEFYYSLATDRGYTTKPKTPEPAKAQQQIAAAKRGQAAAVSISGGNSGRKGADDMSYADLADLSIEDPEMFEVVWDKMAKAGKLGPRA